MKRRSWLWLILGIVLGIALTLAALKICIDRWFAPGTFELSEENIDRLESLDADAIYRLLSEEDADGRWEIISHVPSEDGGLGQYLCKRPRRLPVGVRRRCEVRPQT